MINIILFLLLIGYATWYLYVKSKKTRVKSERDYIISEEDRHTFVPGQFYWLLPEEKLTIIGEDEERSNDETKH